MNPEYSAVSLCFYIIGFCRKAFLPYIYYYIHSLGKTEDYPIFLDQ